jgi:uncharacterized BrkB/YihY/UPF0761 family membrane protein
MKKALIEIWGDVVSAKELLFSIIIISITTMGLYSFAPKGDRTIGLFFGLAGAVAGFLITVYLFSPKRVVMQEGEDE